MPINIIFSMALDVSFGFWLKTIFVILIIPIVVFGISILLLVPVIKIADKLNEGKDVILEIDIQGALEIQEKINDALFIFIMPPSMEILKDRLMKRNTESEDKVLERFKTAYKEINEVTKYNYVVINDRIDVATSKVEAIITAEKCRVDRIEEVDLDSKEEVIHETLTDLI